MAMIEYVVNGKRVREEVDENAPVDFGDGEFEGWCGACGVEATGTYDEVLTFYAQHDHRRW